MQRVLAAQGVGKSERKEPEVPVDGHWLQNDTTVDTEDLLKSGPGGSGGGAKLEARLQDLCCPPPKKGRNVGGMCDRASLRFVRVGGGGTLGRWLLVTLQRRLFGPRRSGL